MSNNVKIGIGIAILIVLGVAGFFIYRAVTDNDGGTSSGVTSDGEAFTGSLAELATRGDSLQCDFNYNDEFSTQTGMMYIDGDRFAGNISMDQDGDITIANILRTDDTQYIYGTANGEDIAFKTPLNDILSKDKEGDAASAAALLDFSDDYNFDCSPWHVDESKFDVPGDVDFLDLSDLLQGLPGLPGLDGEVPSLDGADGDVCVVCDSLSGSTKNDCLAALDCK